MKQTAVEWFYKTIINDPLGDWEYYLLQAKEMEKQQLIKAAYDNMNATEEDPMQDAIEYYNEQFKTK